MKKQKKSVRLISIILTVLLLLSIVPLQSFAAFSLVNPEIKSVAFDDGVMISMKEIEKLHDYYNEDIIVLQNDRDPYYVEPASGFYYDNLIVSFSNGKTVELDRLFDEIPSTTGYSGPKFNVSYEDCKKAIENGDSTVPVNVQFSIIFERGKDKRFEGDVECKIVESYIKSIRPACEFEPFHHKMYYWDYFEGKEMIIEYADGTTKTAPITQGEYIGWFGPLSLDGRPLVAESVYTDGEFPEEMGSTVEFVYCDASIKVPVEVIDCPYRRIDLIDYTVEKNNVLTSITYKITKTNGKTEIRTKECNVTDFTDAVTIDKVGVYRVDVDLNIDMASFKENSVAYIQLSLGDGYSSGSHRFDDRAEYDASDYCNCICHKKGISRLIYLMLIKIWDLFDINEQCKCGAWHWDE
ncbi:MAG: hypothetical protein IKB12_04925 [Clostridia bacterium]|nr:hypothetical protein [Clostridia bacterium]